ncbi:hypothetical protein [Paraburkholderia sp. BCC1876]|uniref:hypothetical protein n=1 Tax=Paraburkholderia sp. BCC1876 TaxID=2676303 RepID=UPI0015921C22|nr:hypothetical protein [Paraburkholderia sp. BCC1876]
MRDAVLRKSRQIGARYLRAWPAEQKVETITGCLVEFCTAHQRGAVSKDFV